jgi:hypothetical protein
MLNKILKIGRKKKDKNFFEYPAKVQKSIIKNAIRGANEMQLALVREYERKRNK